MKSRVIVSFITLLSIHAIAQDLERVVSPYPQKSDELLAATMKPLARHGKLTQMTYMGLNFVNGRIHSFMGIKKAKDGEIKFSGKNVSLQDVYQYYGGKKMFVTFKLFSYGHGFVIEEVDITGDYRMVLDFMVDYWDLNLSFDRAEASKGEIVVNNTMQDRVAFSGNLVKNTASISIRNTQFKNIDEFIKFFKENGGF